MYKFIGDKDLVFKRYLISDLQYVVAGSAIIFLILVGYTKSISVSLISFLVLVLSLGISYFLYTAIFRIPYFPFMNMLVSIIVMGKQLHFAYMHGSLFNK